MIKKKTKKNKIKPFQYILGGIILLAIIFIALFYGGEKLTNPIIEMQTNKGLIVLELNSEQAPNTVENFLVYVDEGFYEGTVFHRVIDGFMIQGGGFSVDGTKKETHDPINIESDNGLTNLKGTVAMARTNEPNSATSQFFINSVNNDFLNFGPTTDGYTVFGKVIEGIEIVEKISSVQTGSNPMPDWPLEAIKIINVTRR